MSESFTETQLRQTLMTVVQQIVTEHTKFPLVVETPNRALVDNAVQVNPYLQVTIELLDGEQAELGKNPNIRNSGQILLAVVVKEGDGTADAVALLDFVLPYFSTKSFGVVQCQAARRTRGRAHGGLWYQPAIVPFFYFSRPA